MNQRQQTSCFSAVFNQSFSHVGPSPKELGSKDVTKSITFLPATCANARLSGLETKESKSPIQILFLIFYKSSFRWSFVYFFPIQNFKLTNTNSGRWYSVFLYAYMRSLGLRFLTLRLLMSYIYIYIYMEHPFLMFLDHTQRRTTVGGTPLD